MYQALYRKWRPQTFDDVYGQPHVTKTLKNELQRGRISHAYLFTGSRGTGKTSCAKILAKAVNCLHPADGNPCNQCEICRGIDGGSILDVIEIDAASNNSVDNIRDLREEANFTPVNTTYRVYIIDEVHMLSIGAFNALLKTLEEPPAHVIFILATTEIHKLPATILSRCQRFDFKRIDAQEITRRLQYIAGQEQITLTDGAAHLIARIADGGMRDALSLFDRCLASGSEIDEAQVSAAAGIADTAQMFAFSQAIAARDFPAALALSAKLYAESGDVKSICSELTLHFRNLLIAKVVKNCDGLIICSAEELQQLKDRAAELPLSKLLDCLAVLTDTAATLKTAVNQRVTLEAALVRLCALQGADVTPAPELTARLAALETAISALSAGQPQAAPAPTETAAADQPDPPPPPEAPPAAPQTSAQPAAPAQTLPDGPFEAWAEVLDRLKTYDMPLFGILAETSAQVRSSRLLINSDNPTLYDFICSDTHSRALSRAVADTLGFRMKIAVSKAEKPKETVSPLENLKSKINVFNQDQANTDTEE